MLLTIAVLIRQNRMSELAEHRAGVQGERLSWCLIDAQRHAVTVAYSCALMTDDLQITLQAALADVAVEQLPFNLCSPALDAAQLQVFLPSFSLPSHQLHAVYPSRRGVVPAVRAFLDMLALEIPVQMDRTRMPRDTRP